MTYTEASDGVHSGTIRRVAELMRHVSAKEIMPRWKNLSATDSREKGPGDWVTVADIAAEAALREGLALISPGVPTVGEEEVAADPRILSRLRSGAAWILDPVDGTRVFRDGSPGFGMIVALAVDGHVSMGWILDCVGDVLLSARSKAGVWEISADGRAEAVTRPERAGTGDGRASYAFFQRTPRLPLDEAGHLIPAGGPRATHDRPSCMNYLDVARGRASFNLAAHAMPWDHAAGTLIVSELGGKCCHLDGELYSVARSDGGVVSSLMPAAIPGILGAYVG